MKYHFFDYRRSICAAIMLAAGLMTSCSDDYFYEDDEPTFLGESIYNYLKDHGNFSNYLRIVDDLNYGQVLSLTGSKTIFPANDEAFGRFFSSNSWGVRNYEQLTYAQKEALLYSSMINMAYLSNMLANVSSADNQSGEGQAIRRATSYSYLDSLSYVTDDTQLSAPFWTAHQGKGLYLVDNEAAPYIVHFTPQHTSTNNIPTSDISLMLGQEYDPTLLYINGIKATETDICCKNGYIHVMSEVLTPERNMSQIIAENGQTGLFNSLMNKFSAPYYDQGLNLAVHTLYSGTDGRHRTISDSIFVKRYFTSARTQDPEGNDMTDYGLLYYDPSDNAYSSLQDMGVMFVPTDEAMEQYINSSKGRYLKDAYGSWDNIPTSLLSLFIKNHQKKSLMSSLPSSWSSMNDESSFKMNVSADDVVKSYIAGNGIVFVTNNVYPPIDYQCVYGPVLTSDDTKIMNAALQNSTMKFSLYLRSMENMYNLLVPTDEALQNYRDPLSWARGKNAREIWAFHYDGTQSKPYTVDIFSVNEDGTKGALKRTSDDQNMILNRLYDICDRHIVVGNIDNEGNMSGYINEKSQGFWTTKGGSTIRTKGTGSNITVQGGGDVEQQKDPAQVVTIHEQPGIYDSDNGRTFIIDRVLQDPTNSVYTNMQQHAEYSKFFELLNGDDRVFTLFKDDQEIRSIFTLNKTSSTSGLGQVVKSFQNFRYTVFVPTNEAIDEAFKNNANLHTWEEINNQDNTEIQREWTINLLRFLNYHFMDNSIYVDGETRTNETYETAARDKNNKFQKLIVSTDANNVSITDAHNNTAHVVKTAGLYNLQSRDIIVNSSDYSRASQIISSSFSVIHLIDKALLPE